MTLKPRRLRGLSITASAGFAVTAMATIALLAPMPALAATAPPTITSAFTPNVIGVGDSTATALSFTITNPNASSSLSNVSLSDTLPPGLAVDDPNGENGTCGSAGVITANPGSQTISLSGGSLKGGTSCTFSVAVVGNQAGTYQNSTGPASSSAGASASGDTETLTVLPLPTVSVSHIRNHARYRYGQVVRPVYSCTQPDAPQDLTDCSASDDLGNSIRSHGWLDTKSPGQHILTVTATSSDGATTTTTINYTVLPDNRFTLTHLTPRPGGALAFRLRLPGAGRLQVRELAGGANFAAYSRRVKGARKLNLDLPPSSAGQALLGAGPVTIKLEVSFTPKGGVKHTVTKRGIVLG